MKWTVFEIKSENVYLIIVSHSRPCIFIKIINGVFVDENILEYDHGYDFVLNNGKYIVCELNCTREDLLDKLPRELLL